MLLHSRMRIRNRNKRSAVPLSPDGANWQTFDRLLGALARFSTQMISVYAEHRESLPEDAQEAFDLCLLDWQAVSSELVVYEPVVPGGGGK